MKKTFVLATVFVVFVSTLVIAAPRNANQAGKVVRGWLKKTQSKPMDVNLGQAAKRIDTFADSNGQSVYHVVYIDPCGYVIVPADDEVEPIVGFSSEGEYDPSPENPMGALVSADMADRVTTARKEKHDPANPKHTPFINARSKWQDFDALADTNAAPPTSHVGSVSDVRVSPLVLSKWNQLTECGYNCYNYYTPNNYYSGCTATAMAQIMRFYQHPAAPSTIGPFTIYVDGSPQSRSLRGGNGSGGNYAWSDMVLDPDCSTTTTQMQAIGALTHDAGVAAHMQYASGSSGAWLEDAKYAFVNVFSYSNAVDGGTYHSATNIGAGLNGMINPCLDANLPCMLGIYGGGGSYGHAIVCDGYGYDTSTLYHHVNMGWSGSYDAWYNLPAIDASSGFDSVSKCTYNLYKTGSGEIISGRVATSSGTPISGVAITASRTGGGTYNATTNEKGVYALAHVPASSSYTVQPTKTGYSFTPPSRSVTTGTSTDYSTSSGNVWGTDFVTTGAGNDMFANAITISGTSGQTTGSNVGATKEVGEPSHAGNAGGASVWWNWTAPFSGPVTIDTNSSSFDTLLGVYTGSSVGSLTLVASDDDGGEGARSLVTFNATSGITYRIAVDGYNGATGTITLNWRLVLPNDNFADANTMSGYCGQRTGSNVGATKEAGEPSHAGNAGGASVWWRWTAPSSCPVTFDTNGSNFDTLLGVYTGSSVGSLTLVASDDDGGEGTRSLVTFNATSGTTYRIAVDGYNGATGDIILNWCMSCLLDTTPPDPNPMTWSTEPYETSTSSISMVATTATDATPPIYYQFDFNESPTGGTGGTDSSWQTSTTYTDSGLQANHEYGYNVRARDSATPTNTGSYSTPISYDYTDIEIPSGITFGTITSASIEANSANTPSGLTRGSSGLIIYNSNGTNSGWKQNNNYWNSSGLSANTQYGFRAKARNGDADETGYCSWAYRYTYANAPGADSFSDVGENGIQANWTANGNPAGTQYLCENITRGTNSGWTSNTYWNESGLSCGTQYCYQVKAKNASGIETSPTSLGCQSTSPCSNFTINASFGPNGTLDPNGAIDAHLGDDIRFEAQPNPGYTVDKWYLDGNDVQTGDNSYALTYITTSHDVYVTFKELAFVISGCIRNECNVPIDGVLVDANNGGGQDITDANGCYEVSVDYNWSGTVTPDKAHYSFDPNSMLYADVLGDIVDQNYAANNIYDLDCDGSIWFGDIGIISENWLDGPDLPGDFYKDEDEIVNFLDFAEFAEHWLEGADN